ncbi:MAG TPA: GMC family oxidoreductase [Blastocatellia bacterium]|nr:GMC family oxidoreductase [Blastocatellia bacterium]
MQRSKRSAAKVYDAIVVGSGATGGWAAKVLTEKGMKVLVLEAGRKIDPAKDYRMMTWPYELKYRGLAPGSVYAPRQPIQSRCYAGNEYSAHLFIDDLDNPYTTPDDKPFWWIRGRQVGGRSLTWGRQSYRLSDYDFKAASHDGYGEDWPIGYQDLEPYYDLVEDFVGISGNYEKLPQLPDSKFLPPMAMTCGERMLKRAVESRWKERTVTIGRAAILTRPHQGRAACHYCGHCDRGCDTHSYYSSVGSTLPAAAKTGNMTLRPNAVVREILIDSNSGLAKGVRLVDQLTKRDEEVYSKVVVLCASTLESTRILLNSKSRQHPNGLGNSSGVLGHYLMDHQFGIGANGVVPVLRGMAYDHSDGRANGIYIPRFRNLKDKQPNFIRGYGMQGRAAMGYSYAHVKQQPGFGLELKKFARENPSEVTFGLGAWCEMLPRKENRVTVDPNKVDAWGIPILHVECSHGDNERAMAKDALETIREMVDAAGFTTLSDGDRPAPPGFCIHEVGTARMGRDPKSSVLNQWNQAWDVKNVFVTDGACYVSQGCQNPTLTMMAITARACEYIAEEYQRGNL